MLALCSPLSNLRISQKLYPRYPLRLETCGIDLHLSEVAKRIRILGWVVVAVAARRPRVGRYKDALAMRANAQNSGYAWRRVLEKYCSRTATIEPHKSRWHTFSAGVNQPASLCTAA